MATPTYSDKFSVRNTIFQEKYPGRPVVPLTWDDEGTTTWDQEGRSWDDTAQAPTAYTPKYT